MKITICVIVAVAFFAALIEAYPERKTVIVYTPPKKGNRQRRAAVGGQVSSNPKGGADVRVQAQEGFGTPNHNVIARVGASGNTNKGPVATSGSLAYNNNGFGASIGKEHIPGVRDSLTQSVYANLYNNGDHRVDATAFKSQNELANGFKFDRNGAGLDYSNANGHGASLSHSNIPGLGSQLELGGKANLWQSQDHNTRLDLTGSGSKWTSGPFSGKTDFNTGLGLTHMFG